MDGAGGGGGRGGGGGCGRGRGFTGVTGVCNESYLPTARTSQ